jgi:hypothetical protein
MLSWDPVPEAVSYTVEVCRDPGCGELVERHTGQAGPPWRPAALPVGDLFWRVTARSRSGLDGYPSEAAALRVSSERVNLPAPSGSLQVTGPQVRVGERLIVPAAARVEVTAVDAAGAPARWIPLIGGREETAWPAAWTAGEQIVEAIALDGCGNRGPLEPVAFVVDTEPPVLHWEAGDRGRHEGRLASDSESDRRRLKGRRSGGKAARDAWASEAGVWQLPLPWVQPKPGVRPAEFPITIASDQPQAFLAAPGSELAVDGKAVTLGGGILRIAAEDAGAGVDRLVLKTRAEGDRVILEVEASDLVGNVSRKEITLERAASR